MKVLIVDDERPARARLRDLLSSLPVYMCCGEAGNGAEALRQVQLLQPDIVLMDIRMPVMDGLEAARHLATLDRPPAVVFTTAYGEYALEAFDAHGAGYLLKPIDSKRLESALISSRLPNRAQLAELSADGFGPRRSHISARLGGKLELIPLGDVLYFQADQKYVIVRHRRGTVIIEDSLKALETEFASLCLRIHRNTLVMTNHLMGMERTREGRFQIILDDGTDRLEVSRRHVAQVKRFLKS